MEEKKFIWAVYSAKTELLEIPRVVAICEIEATARRLAYRSGMQGGNHLVEQVVLYRAGDACYAPIKLLTIIGPTNEDICNQSLLDEKQRIIKKARIAGFTDAELEILRS